MSEEMASIERERLFELIGDLVQWKNINNEELLENARLEIARSIARNLNLDVPVGKSAIYRFLIENAPPLLDPFAGGGSIPLEAQRLGLRAYASDLNPVAVLINKAMIEIPPKFAGIPPIHPSEGEEKQKKQQVFWKKEWSGTRGIAEDVRYYGQWMKIQAENLIGWLYPKVKVTKELLLKYPELRIHHYKDGEEAHWESPWYPPDMGVVQQLLGVQLSANIAVINSRRGLCHGHK